MRPSLPRQLRQSVAAMLLAMLVGLILTGCEIAEPELPTYTTSVAVPLGQERLDIADVVDDEDYLIAMEDGTLGFQVEGDPDTVSLDLELAADIPSQTVSGDLGNFSLDVASPPSFDFALVDLYPAAAALDGMTMPVPGFQFTTASDPEDLADLDSATLSAGTLTVTVSNGLPVPVSAASGPDRLVLELVDPGTGSAVVTLEFDPIAGGSQAQRVADLAGVTLPGALSVRLAGGSPGSGGSPVLVDASAAIAVDAQFSDLEVSSANAVVGAQEFTTSFDTDLPDDYAVEQAVIAGGSVSLTVTNEMPMPCQAVVRWPEIVNLDDEVLELVVDLAGDESATESLSFAGYLVRAPAGQQLSVLAAEVAVTSPGSGGLAVPLSATDGVRADLSGGRIEFGSVTGAVPALSYDFDPLEEEIDLPDELEGLSFTHASIVLELTNSAGINAQSDLYLRGVNADGREESLVIQEQILAAEDGRASTTRIELNEGNSTVVEFLNNLPTEISLTGGVELGGDGSVGTVRPDDFAVVNWEIIAPVEVVIESSQMYGDPEELDLDEDIRDNIEDYAGDAAVNLRVLNHLPVGVEASILFSPDTTTIKTQPILVIGPVSVDAADVDPGTHTVSEPRVSTPTISLTADEVRLLATEGLHQIFEVTLPSTDGNPVRVLTTDYVEITGLIDLDVNIHDTDDDQ